WDYAPDLPAAHAVAANTLDDGVIQVHAVTSSPAGDLRLLSTTWANGEWEKTGWQSHGQTGKKGQTGLTDRAAIPSVTPTSASPYLIGPNNPMLVRPFKNGVWPAPGDFKPVHGLTFGPDSSLAAVSRDPRSIDVVAVTAFHTLAAISASPDPNFIPA